MLSPCRVTQWTYSSNSLGGEIPLAVAAVAAPSAAEAASGAEAEVTSSASGQLLDYQVIPSNILGCFFRGVHVPICIK